MRACRKSVTAKLFWTISLAITYPGVALAQVRPGIQSFVNIPEACYLTEPIQPASLYSFMKVQVQALWLARKGEESILDLLSARGALPRVEPARLITGLRTERIQTTCAGFVMSAFDGSSDKNIAAAARSIEMGYQQLANLPDEMLPTVMYAGVESMRDSTRARFADWTQKHQDIMTGLTNELYFSLSLLIDTTRVDPAGKPDHMIFTAAERNSLLEYLNSKFPSLQKNKDKQRPGGILGQASLIYAFLTADLKTADVQ